MFWDKNDLGELAGTYVVGLSSMPNIFGLTADLATDKLGKDDAERTYNEVLLPVVRVCTFLLSKLKAYCQQSRPDLFPTDLIADYYSMEQYHIMGSRILSRSFDVERWEGDEGNSDNDEAAEASVGSAMDVDQPAHSLADDSARDEEPSDEEEDDIDVSMVPVADLLNARYRSENVTHASVRFAFIVNYLIPGQIVLRANRTKNADNKTCQYGRTNRGSSVNKLCFLSSH